MNEWSPGGNYSRPGTPNQTIRTFRSQWEEPDKGTKPIVVNIRSTADNRIKPTYQPNAMEDSKSSVTTCTKNKKVGNGVSDPRFKRVISSAGPHSDVSVGSEGKTRTFSKNDLEKDSNKSKSSDWNGQENRSNWSETVENRESSNPQMYTEAPVENPNLNAQEPTNFDQSQDHLKAVDKLLFNHDILTKSFSKESLSNSTVNTRNSSMGSEDLVEEYPNELSMFPSATRVKKVQNWIQNQKKPERKQSVITVIGQTQGQDALSSALREIDKRRKLVKELDKYAVCQKIVESDKEKEISELVEKLSSLTSTKKSLYEDEKPFGRNETLNNLTKVNESKSNKSNKYRETSNNGRTESLTKTGDASSDSMSPVLELRKRSSSKKKTKKSQLNTESFPKGKIKELLVRIQCQWIFCVVVILSGALCWLTFFALQNGSYVSFDLFSQKPKKMTWYEKICNWIWELFRPSGNYQRTAPWNPY